MLILLLLLLLVVHYLLLYLSVFYVGTKYIRYVVIGPINQLKLILIKKKGKIRYLLIKVGKLVQILILDYRKGLDILPISGNSHWNHYKLSKWLNKAHENTQYTIKSIYIPYNSQYI